MRKRFSTCAPGPLLFEDGFDKPATRQWCNAHLNTTNSAACKRAAITLDTEHPMYGTLATLTYPSDRWPFVVIGGSKTGGYLVFAPVATGTNGETFDRERALAEMQPGRARKVYRSRDGRYDSFTLGHARYYLAPEV